jgi:hypothetical protein
MRCNNKRLQLCSQADTIIHGHVLIKRYWYVLHIAVSLVAELLGRSLSKCVLSAVCNVQEPILVLILCIYGAH